MISAALRRSVHERARGRCEDCFFPHDDGFAPHEIDHIYAEKYGGTSDLDNLCLAYRVCNRHKGTDLASLAPETNLITPLFHPRHDRWSAHFSLDSVVIVPLTPVGRVTVRLLQLNRADRLSERQLLLEMGLYPE